MKRSLLLLRRLMVWCCLAAGLLAALPALAHEPVTAPPAHPAVSGVFGIETNTGRLPDEAVLGRAQELSASWVRLNTISWRQVQPAPHLPPDAWNWDALATFEHELEAARQAGLTPLVVVDDSPPALTRTNTSCGAIKSEYFAAFARFMQALLQRYAGPPYHVRYWELGNEVDIDPRLVPIDNAFGCWGDIEDPYYGGEHYGHMLNVVTPAMRAVDPDTQVVIGGFLLDRPDSTGTLPGNPELFFEGVLRAGAGDNFDIVSFHKYTLYMGPEADSDLSDSRWAAWGGMTLGKVRFLRETMRRYGINKPLFISEAALLSRVQTDDFWQAQSDHIVRTMLRAMSADVRLYSWYTLHDNGWWSAGLLDEDEHPRAPFIAYQELIQQVGHSATATLTFVYGDEIEAYRLGRRDGTVDVLWASVRQPVPVSVPRADFIAAYTRDGEPLVPRYEAGAAWLSVGISPIYIHRVPQAAAANPTIDRVIPQHIWNDTPTDITIRGTGFSPDTRVLLDKVRLNNVQFIDSTRLQAHLPAHWPTGTYRLEVHTTDGTGAALEAALTVQARIRIWLPILYDN